MNIGFWFLGVRSPVAERFGWPNPAGESAPVQAEDPGPEVLLTGLPFPLTILLDMHASPQLAGFFRPDHDPPPIQTVLLI